MAPFVCANKTDSFMQKQLTRIRKEINMGNYDNLVFRRTCDDKYEVCFEHPLLDKKILHTFSSKWLALVYFRFINFLWFLYLGMPESEFRYANEMDEEP